MATKRTVIRKTGKRWDMVDLPELQRSDLRKCWKRCFQLLKTFQTLPAGTHWDSWLPSSTRDNCILLLRKCLNRKLSWSLISPVLTLSLAQIFALHFKTWHSSSVIGPQRWLSLLGSKHFWAIMLPENYSTTVKIYKDIRGLHITEKK